MKQQLVIKEAFRENTSKALQETARCSCFRTVCGPASCGADGLGWVGLVLFSWLSFVSCFIPQVLQGWSWGCTVLPGLRQQLMGEFDRGTLSLMSFRQTLAGNLWPSFVCRVGLDDSRNWHLQSAVLSPEANVTSKNSKCKYSWKGWRFTLLMAWEWVHEN